MSDTNAMDAPPCDSAARVGHDATAGSPGAGRRRRGLLRAALMGALALTAAIFAACGGGPPGREKIVYAGSNWFGHAPVWVGVRKGFFADAGFDVDARAFGPSSDRLTAIESGAAQFASVGEVAMLAAMAEGRDGFYWIGSQDIAPGNEGLVGVGVESIADLRGKRIAVNVGTSVHVTAYELLRGAGLDIGKDVEVLRAADSAVVDLVRSGEAAAGIIWEPFYTDLRAIPGAKVLGTDEDTSMYRRFKTMTGPDVVCASRTWVDADPARAKRFFRAYFDAVAWCQANPEELAGIVAEQVGKKPDEVAPALRRFRWLDRQAQRVVMSDAMLFGQAVELSRILVEMEILRSEPDFRRWTRPEVLAD
jgi:ABC-type nitrate/sulfonate/bicarbonate transport system substrate-binding protein